MTDELTSQDKAKILGVTDGKSVGQNTGYDQAFYEAMKRVAPLQSEEVDDSVRRAILRYISDGDGEASKPENGGLVMMGFIHGYLVGLELQRDIRENPRP
jgi:hypothetical protein